MIEDIEVAKQVSHALIQAFDVLGNSIVIVNERCSREEAEAYREKVGNIFYDIVFKMLEPLSDKHPELKPLDWDDRV